MAEQKIERVHIPSVMEDPSVQAVARIYAKAFLKSIVELKAESALDELEAFVHEVLEKVEPLRQILFSRIIGRDDKLGLVDRVIAPRVSQLAASFLRVLARHDRLELLPIVVREARLRHEVQTGHQRVQVTSALALSPEAVRQIHDRLAATFPFEPILETRVNSALIGGIVIRVGDTVYDSSLKTRVKQLHERLRERSIHEIQSGRDRFSPPEGD